MKIIAEKINGTRKSVARAIKERDAEFIQVLAVKQADAGSDWLDVNAGTPPDRETDDLIWLIDTIQSVVDVPLCLDSANPEALKIAVQKVNKTPMINSISGEQDRLATILPIVAEYGCQVIALAMDGAKIPDRSEERVQVVERIIDFAHNTGIPDDALYIDPLAMTIATNNQSAMVVCETIRIIKSNYSEVHFTIGLSNISFGLPARKQINRAFLIMAMQAGLDSAILDPLDNDLQAAIITAEMLLGRDRYCMNYIKAAKNASFV